MATNKKATPAGYDRWDTFPGTTKGTGKPLTETQKKAIERVQKKRNAAKAKRKK